MAVILLAVCCLAVFPDVSSAVSEQEQKRIDILLDALVKRDDIVFIRNGSKHTAREAVDHLRLKLSRAGKRITTAEEFIDHLATASSLSKKPYMIQQPGKEPEPAGLFLHKMLREVAPRP